MRQSSLKGIVVFWLRRMAVILALGLAGCGGAGLGGSALLGGVQPAATPAALDAKIDPPLPERRPSGKDTKKTQVAAAPEASNGPEAAGGKAEARPGIVNLFTQAALPQGLFKPGKFAPAMLRVEMKPVEAYTVIARGVKNCWLLFSNPRLKNHNFDAEASPQGSGDARISIYEKVKDQKLGRFAYRIDLKADGGGTLIEHVNLRLSPADSTDLQADVARWAKGGEGCAK